MRSVPEAGEYRITIFNRCGDTASFSFYVFSSNINNLSIASWGSNAVTARWSACGMRPAVTTSMPLHLYLILIQRLLLTLTTRIPPPPQQD